MGGHGGKDVFVAQQVVLFREDTGPLMSGQQAEAVEPGKSLEVRVVGWLGAGSYGRFVSWDDITGAPSPQKSIGSSEQCQVMLSTLQQKQAG